jgi:pimeloyl-ACP methyl ester carboxylesterase
MCKKLISLKEFINLLLKKKMNPGRIATTVSLFISIVFLLACDKETDLNPVYQPAVKKQFGDITAYVQEVSFQKNGFKIVGDLRTPLTGDKHPAIIMVHGSGDATRHGSVPFEPLIEIFLRQGFAVLSWDKPGNGASKGEFDTGYTLTGRAEIIVEAIKLLSNNPNIRTSSIGLWVISQAGWVMPIAMTKTNNISFMIVVSGGGEDSIEQQAYLISQVVACDGGSIQQIEAADLNWSKMIKATEYNIYREAADKLVDIPGVSSYTGLTVSEEDEWKPWPREIDAFFNPMDVVQNTTIPMLVFFGELDKNIDPVQGAQAYEAALNEAGNDNYVIKVIEDVGHILTPATNGCLSESVSSEYVQEYLILLEDWISDLDF